MSVWQGKYGPLLIAEIGGNHEGDFDYALRLTDLAISADVDVIKFQLYTGDTLVSRLESPQRNQHFKKFQLTNEQHIQLAEKCNAAGIKYMASVWDEEFLKWIDPYIPIYKIGSGDMTAYPVLRTITGLKKPIILSTGLSTLEEVKNAVAFIQSCDPLYKDPEYLSVLQCTSMYPIEDSDSNLMVMKSYEKELGLTVGYSDHTIGMYAMEIAVALGAQILEFHFTDTREGKEFRDHKVSLTADEVKELQKKITTINALKGDGVKQPLESEKEHRTSFRRAVYPNQDLKAGTMLTNENITTLRPNHGIDARDYDKVLNKTLKVDVSAHQKLDWDMLD